jgi:hypothetical protein
MAGPFGTLFLFIPNLIVRLRRGASSALLAPVLAALVLRTRQIVFVFRIRHQRTFDKSIGRDLVSSSHRGSASGSVFTLCWEGET